MTSVTSRSSSQSPSLHPAAQFLSYLLTLTVHLPVLRQATSVCVGVLGQLAPQEMGGGGSQSPAKTVQASPLMLQMPADAPSSVSGVQSQVPQTGQPPPGTVQAAPPLLQAPAVASSKIEGVQLQVPQTGTTGQLFAATVQGWDGKPVQEAPPHPADTAWLLDCVPALDASVVDGVQLQLPQDPH